MKTHRNMTKALALSKQAGCQSLASSKKAACQSLNGF